MVHTDLLAPRVEPAQPAPSDYDFPPTSEPSTASHKKRPGSGRRRSILDIFALRPGWPLAVLFIGFPLWWAALSGDYLILTLVDGVTTRFKVREAIARSKELGIDVLGFVFTPRLSRRRRVRARRAGRTASDGSAR
jgi:hypothetical protein